MNNGIPEKLREKSGNSGAVREEWRFHVKSASEHSWSYDAGMAEMMMQSIGRLIHEIC